LRNRLTILKLGGSVITVKDKPLTPNVHAIKRLAEEISRAEARPLIIVHGGGSFGHPLAKKYGISEGFKDASQVFGASETHQAMVSLNDLLVKSLLEHDLPAFSISPSSFIMTRNGRIQDLNEEILGTMLESGLIPVLYGDVVMDSERGFAILSGDQIAAALAVKLKAERIIMGIDVDGLYDSDPKSNPDAQLINHISAKELPLALRHVGPSRVPDVTGGMMGKILELKVAVESDVEVLIINALSPENVYRALRGEDVVGTRIER
jgi:isopentenyl phosphate kinase